MKIQLYKKMLFVIPAIIGFTNCNAQKEVAKKRTGN